MNYTRIALASLGAFAVYFALGGAIFGLFPSLRNEFLKYPAVYRSQEGQISHMSVGMPAMFFSMVAIAIIYAMLYRGHAGVAEGARLGAIFGALIGFFAVCSFVFHNYVNLNIGLTITIQSAIAYMVEWTATGLVIGLIYRPIVPR